MVWSPLSKSLMCLQVYCGICPPETTWRRSCPKKLYQSWPRKYWFLCAVASHWAPLRETSSTTPPAASGDPQKILPHTLSCALLLVWMPHTLMFCHYPTSLHRWRFCNLIHLSNFLVSIVSLSWMAPWTQSCPWALSEFRLGPALGIWIGNVKLCVNVKKWIEGNVHLD